VTSRHPILVIHAWPLIRYPGRAAGAGAAAASGG